jgi:hypothetical protein
MGMPQLKIARWSCQVKKSLYEADYFPNCAYKVISQTNHSLLQALVIVNQPREGKYVYVIHYVIQWAPSPIFVPLFKVPHY